MSAPAVAVSNDGKHFIAAWKDIRTGGPHVWWAEADEPKFASETGVADGARVDEDHPSLALDARGRAWIAWENGGGRDTRVRLRSLGAGGEARDLSDAAQGMASYPVLASGKDFLVAVWEAGGNGNERVFASVIETAGN